MNLLEKGLASETIKIKKKLGIFGIPCIPDLCWCGCSETVWNGHKFINGHSSRGKFNPSFDKHWNLGVPKSEQMKLKNSKSHNGKPRDEKTKQIILKNLKKGQGWNKGKGEFLSPEKRENVTASRKFKKDKPETIEKKRQSRLGILNPAYIDGRSYLPYCHKFNNPLRQEVRLRDSYTCQLCGKTQEQNSRKLHVHHIHYDKSNCYPDLCCLCCSCNSKVNKKSMRSYYESLFMNMLNRRGLLFWTKMRERC